MLSMKHWACLFVIASAAAVQGLELHDVDITDARTSGVVGTPTHWDGAWYDAAAPMMSDDPLIKVAGELTMIAKPSKSAVLNAVYEAAAERLPSAESFEGSDLGESAGSKGHRSKDFSVRLQKLLSEASKATDSNAWASLDQLDSFLHHDGSLMKDGGKLTSHTSHSPPVHGTSLRSGKLARQLDLDHSKDFVPSVLIQLDEHSPMDVRNELQHLRREQRHLKRQADDDMAVAEITSNDVDLRKGLKEVEQLKHVDHELKVEKRVVREQEQSKEGGQPAQDVLTRRSDLEQRVENRLWKAHLLRLQLHAKNVKKQAYDAAMHVAKLEERADEGKKQVSKGDIQKADAMASLAADKSKAAEEALEAALGEDKDLKAFSPRAPTQATAVTDTVQIDKRTAEKYATKTAVHAEHAIENALMTDSSFDKAAKAAAVALAYERTADQQGKNNMKQATSEVEKAKEQASQAMAEAIQSGTQDSYFSLRNSMANLRKSQDKLQNMRMKQKMDARLKKVTGVSEDPSVMVSQRMAEDSDAKFYKEVKEAERAYQKAEESDKENDIDSVQPLVNREEKAAQQSTEDSLQLVNLRTTVAAKRTEAARKDAKAAIKAEHIAAQDYQKARNQAWSSITAKESAEISYDHAHEQVRGAEEKLADGQATVQDSHARYKRLKNDEKDARYNLVAANAIYKTSKRNLQRREDTLRKMRKETTKGVAKELKRLSMEVGILEKTGHANQAKHAIERSGLDHDRKFLNDERTNELDERINHIKKESTTSLSEEMNQLIKDEKDKLQREVASSGKQETPNLEAQSSELDKKLAALSQKADTALRSEIQKLHTKKQKASDVENNETDQSKAISQMFKQVAQFQAANNEKEKKKKDAKYVTQFAHAPVQKLKRMQSVADKPLAVAEEELQKVIRVEKQVKDKLATNTFAGYAEAHGQGNLDQKFTNAKRALKLAKQAMDGASTATALNRAKAKTKAAKKLMKNAKLAKIQAERHAVEQKLEKANRAQASKRSALKKETDAAAEVLQALQQSGLEKAKTKILEAQMRHDRWKLQSMEDKLDEDRLAAKHARHNFDGIAARTNTAHWAYTKAKHMVELEKRHVQKLRERSDAARRHQDTATKVTHLADDRYREAGEELKALKREGHRKEQVLKKAKKDLKAEEKSEQKAIMNSDTDHKSAFRARQGWIR